MTRSHAHVEQIRLQGAEPVVCDVFDKDQLRDAVVAAKPEVVIHQLTNIPRCIDPRRIKTAMATTNRLRTEGTRTLWAGEIGRDFRLDYLCRAAVGAWYRYFCPVVGLYRCFLVGLPDSYHHQCNDGFAVCDTHTRPGNASKSDAIPIFMS